MLYPLTMFCCGCRVVTGGYMVLFLHLVACAFYIYSAICTLIYSVPSFSSAWTPGEQLVGVGFCLMGIPLILSAIYGLYFRLETNIKMYLYYLGACFVCNVYSLFVDVLFVDQCAEVGSFTTSMQDSFGEAFICGWMNIAIYFFAATAMITEAYFLWVFWTLCEDVHCGTIGPELAGLLTSKSDIVQQLKRPQDGPYADIVGLAHAKVPGPYPYPDGYNAISTIGMPGQGTLFGGSNHETNYPPSI